MLSTTKFILTALLVAVVLVAVSAVTAEAKKPNLKNTTWAYVQKEFVADAGTMTITTSLELLATKECIFKNRMYLPAHAAMYVNPDGTMDKIPASFSESEKKGTWAYRRGKLTVTLEDGTTRVFTYQQDGTFSGPSFFNDEERVLVYTKQDPNQEQEEE